MNQQQKKFVATIKTYYKKHGRHDLPWRLTDDPYKIAVSEMMLQQTQVTRVIEKYHAFLAAFPTMEILAAAPLQQVLLLWSGLGYNRRARFLQAMARAVIAEHRGIMPGTTEGLRSLPGIGHYTAGAIMAFSYNKPVAIIETNIRTAYLHHFFADATVQVTDKDLLPLIAVTLDIENPRKWYWALMDYGSYLKKSGVRIHRSSAQYKKQTTFKGSLRQVRGGIVKILAVQPATVAQLQKKTGFEKERIQEAIHALATEGLVYKKGQLVAIS